MINKKVCLSNIVLPQYRIDVDDFECNYKNKTPKYLYNDTDKLYSVAINFHDWSNEIYIIKVIQIIRKYMNRGFKFVQSDISKRINNYARRTEYVNWRYTYNAQQRRNRRLR